MAQQSFDTTFEAYWRFCALTDMVTHKVEDPMDIGDTSEQVKTPDIPSSASHTAAHYEPMLQQVTVLVVDDESSIAELVQEVLVSAGYRVLQASNGRIALAIARREHPAMVLTDRMMPEVDGIEFVRRMHAGASTRHIPVVMMSSDQPISSGETQPLAAVDRLRARHIPGVNFTSVDDQCVPFLRKPFDIDALLDVVETVAGSDPQQYLDAVHH